MIETKFKQTEIGLIPEDWEIKPLDDFIQDIAEGPFGSNLKLEHYTLEKEARIIQLGNISENGWNDSNVKYTTFNHANEIHRCIVTPGEIVIAKMMPAGRAIKCPNKEKMYILSSDAVRLTPNEIIDSDYLLASINFTSFRKQISEKTQGSTRARTNIPKLRESVLPLPKTIKEQYFIAQALNDIDALIVSLDNLISKKNVIKQGAMQQLLTGKKRLKGFNSPWVEKKLGDICCVSRGNSLQSENFKSGNIPVIAGGKSIAGYHNISNFNSKTITVSASGANAGYVWLHNTPIFATDCSIISESEEYNISYLFYCMSLLQNNIIKMQTGGAQPHVQPKDLKSLNIIYSENISEQNAIANVLTSMDNEIESLVAKRAKYVSIKQGMMQQLLTGKIRLV